MANASRKSDDVKDVRRSKHRYQGMPGGMPSATKIIPVRVFFW
jgi:hypothetical protein